MVFENSLFVVWCHFLVDSILAPTQSVVIRHMDLNRAHNVICMIGVHSRLTHQREKKTYAHTHLYANEVFVIAKKRRKVLARNFFFFRNGNMYF